MKILKNRQPLTHKKIFGIIFMTGFLLGIIYANVIGKNYMESSGILSDYFLSRYKYYDIDNSNLFFIC